MLYFIKQLTPERFEVAKFDTDHQLPLDTYNTFPSQPNCSCPAYKPDCKHTKMVKEWLKLPKPHLCCYDDKLKEFIVNPFAQTEEVENALKDIDAQSE